MLGQRFCEQNLDPENLLIFVPEVNFSLKNNTVIYQINSTSEFYVARQNLLLLPEESFD